MTHAIDRLLSFCWWKSILKILGLLICGLNLGSRPSMQLAGILPSDLPAFFYIISILLFSETMYSQLSMVEMLAYLMMIPARTAFKLVKWFFTFHFLWVVQLNVINLISFFSESKVSLAGETLDDCRILEMTKRLEKSAEIQKRKLEVLAFNKVV